MALLNVSSWTKPLFLMILLLITTDLDFNFITDSWLCPGDHTLLVELCPSECDCFSHPWKSGRGGGQCLKWKKTAASTSKCCSAATPLWPTSSTGGGLISVYKKHLKWNQILCDDVSTFEVLMLKLCGPFPTILAVIYRPPSPTAPFLREFPDFFY